MTKIKPLLMMLMLISHLAVIGKAQSKASSPSTGNLKLGLLNERTLSDARDLPGCLLSLTLADAAEGRSIFASDLSTAPGGEAIINLDGKETKLLLVEDGGDHDLRVGARSWKIYTADDVTLRCDFTLTAGCSPPKDDCEAFDYKAILTVSRKGQKTVVETVGSCGS